MISSVFAEEGAAPRWAGWRSRRILRRGCSMTAVAVGALLCLPAAAFGDAMDPVLGRLRLAGGEGDCSGDVDHCVDQAGFERLAAALGMAFLSPLGAPAHTDGPAGTSVFLSTTGTVVDSDRSPFNSASEAAVQGDDPDPGLLVHRLQVRQGLPMGFEVGGGFGRASNTSLWTLGVQLKLALFEGFRTGWGVLPDVAVRLSWDGVVGAKALSLQVLAADVTFSKPLILGPHLRIAPLVGAQLAEVRASTGLVDLTPDVDDFAACAPATEPRSGLPQCTGDAAGLAQLVAFAPVSQVRLRFVAGVAVEVHAFRFGAVVMAELPGTAPRTRARDADGTRARLDSNLAATATAGISF